MPHSDWPKSPPAREGGWDGSSFLEASREKLQSEAELSYRTFWRAAQSPVTSLPGPYWATSQSHCSQGSSGEGSKGRAVSPERAGSADRDSVGPRAVLPEFLQSMPRAGALALQFVGTERLGAGPKPQIHSPARVAGRGSASHREGRKHW